MLGTIWSYLPTWVPWVVGAVVLAATIPYWTPIWVGLPKPFKYAILAAGGLFTAWHAGRRQQRIVDADNQKQAEAKAVERRQEIHKDVKKLSDDDVDRELHDSGWLRD